MFYLNLIDYRHAFYVGIFQGASYRSPVGKSSRLYPSRIASDYNGACASFKCKRIRKRRERSKSVDLGNSFREGKNVLYAQLKS